LGTPLFHESLADNRFLPLAKLRDMDGFTLMTKPLDNLDDAAVFARQLARLDGHRSRILYHCLGFYMNYRRSLSGRQMAHLLANSLRLAVPSIIHRGRLEKEAAGEASLTYVTTTQPLGPLFTPAFPVSEKFRGYFAPTMITDASGVLDEKLALDLEARRPPERHVTRGGAREAG
jgi:hypothetical protein